MKYIMSLHHGSLGQSEVESLFNNLACEVVGIRNSNLLVTTFTMLSLLCDFYCGFIVIGYEVFIFVLSLCFSEQLFPIWWNTCTSLDQTVCGVVISLYVTLTNKLILKRLSFDFTALVLQERKTRDILSTWISIRRISPWILSPW